ncbi:MAG: hypothetical protein EKK64_01735 [Neisseriaceae bacterium]|nr:MAG: hypothetical protein EKK64_01735 [Neisseriaceae bacterium]
MYDVPLELEEKSYMMDFKLGSHFVIQKPCRRIIYFRQQYYLSFPYCIFTFRYTSLINHPVEMGFFLSDGKEIYHSPLPNTSPFYCCIGEGGNEQVKANFKFDWAEKGRLENEKEYLKKLTDFMISIFWASKFNTEYRYSRDKYCDKKLFETFSWDEKTKEKDWVPGEEDLVPIEYVKQFPCYGGVTFSETDFKLFREKVLKQINFGKDSK